MKILHFTEQITNREKTTLIFLLLDIISRINGNPELVDKNIYEMFVIVNNYPFFSAC